MFSQAPKQLLKTEVKRAQALPETSYTSEAFQELFWTWPAWFLFTDTWHLGHSLPPVGCKLFLGKEPNLGFQELFVQGAAILWLLCSSGVEKLPL